MRTPISTVLSGLLLCAAAGAQTWEVSGARMFPYISKAPLGSISEESKKDTDTTLKALEGYGARLTRNTKGYYGHELGYNYIRARLSATVRETVERETTTTVLQERVTVRQAYYNFLMYMMPKGERWRPFIAAGAQAVEYGAPSFDLWPTGKARTYGFNYGGGIKLQLMRNALLRLDARDYIAGKPYDLDREDQMSLGGRLRMLEASVGISITFR